jgi:hypothetical protein
MKGNELGNVHRCVQQLWHVTAELRPFDLLLSNYNHSTSFDKKMQSRRSTMPVLVQMSAVWGGQRFQNYMAVRLKDGSGPTPMLRDCNLATKSWR